MGENLERFWTRFERFFEGSLDRFLERDWSVFESSFWRFSGAFFEVVLSEKRASFGGTFGSVSGEEKGREKEVGLE